MWKERKVSYCSQSPAITEKLLLRLQHSVKTDVKKKNAEDNEGDG